MTHNLFKTTLFACAFFWVNPFAAAQSPNTLPTTGNVGIGTSVPACKLEVLGASHLNGTLLIDSTAKIGSNLIVTGTTQLAAFEDIGLTENRLLAMDANGKIIDGSLVAVKGHYLRLDSALKIGDNSFHLIGSTAVQPVNYMHGTLGPIVINGTPLVLPQNTIINPGSGNVGIGTGTLAPGAKVSVGGNAHFNGIVGIGMSTFAPGSKLQVGGNSHLNGSVGVGTPPDDHISLAVRGADGDIGVCIDHTDVSNFNYAFKEYVNQPETKAIAVIYRDANPITLDAENFTVLGNGVTMIGGGGYVNNMQLKVETAMPTGLYVKSTDAAGALNYVAIRAEVNKNESKALQVISTHTGVPKEVFRVQGNGVTYSQELRVRMSPFPDYVFEEDYRLMGLDSLAAFVEAEKRLPGFPSAAEIAADDANVGELVRLQQEKIEELTLYLIEMDKQLKEMRLKLEGRGE
jgi:hypothetical protein